MDRLFKEIERIKKDEDKMLDRKCIGLDSVTIIFCDTKKSYNLTGDYFTNKNSHFDPTWAGAYITPGEITTLRNIHIHAIMCMMINKLLDHYLSYHYIPEEEEKLFKEYMPDFFKEIQLIK